MTATSVLTLTVYLAIMVIVATAAVGIRSGWRELPPVPPPPIPVPVRQKGTAAARGRHPFAHGPGRLARYAWRMSRVLARRTGRASVAAVRATPELPAHAARLGRHVAVRAEVGREAFDHGASRRFYRLLHPGLRRLVPLRERTGRLVLALLGPLRDLADRAATAGRNAAGGTGSAPAGGSGNGPGSEVDTWQLRVAAIRRRAAQWRVPRPRRAGDLEPVAPAHGDPAAVPADGAGPAGPPDDELAPLETGDDVVLPADEKVLGDWSRPAADQVSASAPATVPPTGQAPAPVAAAPSAPAAPPTPAPAAPSAPAPTASSAPSAAAAPAAEPSAATVQREALAEPRPTPSAAALSAARLALAGIHRDHAARHQAAARQAARHHGQQRNGEHAHGLDDEDRVIDLTAVEAEVEAR